MPARNPAVDPEGLLEYSVVFSDRSLNHMSARFRERMRALSAGLCATHGADELVLVPGGGSFAMEAVARAFARGRRCLVLRNGWFSHRWVQIFEAGRLPAACTVLQAQPLAPDRPQSAWQPAPLDRVLETIARERPDCVFAAQVETSAGILLPETWIAAIGAAARQAGALFVLDAVAAGAVWADMAQGAIDVLLSAPQKGWSASPCAGVVLLGARAIERLPPAADSFVLDLGRWRQIMQAYAAGGHAYHATLPTDALAVFADRVEETRAAGLARLRTAQFELGKRIRALLGARGHASVAAPGFEAPSVVVCHTDDPALHDGSRFVAAGLQIAAGVPLMCGEPAGFRSFRIGLFGLDKLLDVEGCVQRFEQGLDALDRSRA